MRLTMRTMALAGVLAVGGFGGHAASAQGSYGYGAGGYGRGPSFYPGTPVSPAQRQGFREGERFYETGIAPHHRLSPAEARGFVAGERREARTPLAFDPAKQRGLREGERYWETGRLPQHRLSPAERQGFFAGERRAANGRW